VIVVQRVLARENWHRLSEGQPADAVYPVAVAEADLAFDQLRNGLGMIGTTSRK